MAASVRRSTASLMALGLLWTAVSQAHTSGSTGYAEVTLHEATIRYRLTLPAAAVATLDPDHAATQLAQRVTVTADGHDCIRVPGPLLPPTPERASASVIIDFACTTPPQELGLRDDLSDLLGGDYHTLTSVVLAGGTVQQVLEPARRMMRLPVRSPTEAASQLPPGSGLAAFFRFGLEHILTGFDHLLFLAALLLRGGGIGSLFAIVTAFTAAHSITLGLAVLRIASLSPALIEPVIALSIAYVAAENILARQPPRRRWIEGFGFGLVHGFGFAGALLDLDLPAGALVGSLLAFNLGVEAGQALVVAALLPLLLWLRRRDSRRPLATGLSACVLAAGLALLIERVLVAVG